MLFQNCAALLLSTLISTQFASGAAIEQQPMQPASNPSNLPTLADVLTIEPSLSIFYSYARELDLSRLLSDDSARMTLLAPKNKAVMAMHRKPHQDTETDSTVITEEEFDTVSKNNVERWVSAHIIPAHPIELRSQTHQTMLDGRSVTFKPLKGSSDASPEWQRVVADGGIQIVDMKEASNGVVYIIDGTIDID